MVLRSLRQEDHLSSRIAEHPGQCTEIPHLRKKNIRGVGVGGEMARWLTALAALPKDQGFISSNHNYI